MPNCANSDVLQMLRVIAKIFYKSNQYLSCPYLMVDNNLEPWIQFFKTMLDMPPPGQECVKTDDYQAARQMNRTLFWKTKGRIAKTCWRMFVEYSDPNKVEDKAVVRGFSADF